MLRLLLSLLIVVSLLMVAYFYAKSTLFKRTDNSTTVIELGRTVKDVREMNEKRKIHIYFATKI